MINRLIKSYFLCSTTTTTAAATTEEAFSLASTTKGKSEQLSQLSFILYGQWAGAWADGAQPILNPCLNSIDHFDYSD